MFEKVFNEYASKYDFLDKNIILKYNHSYRVRTLSLKYAKLLGFDKRDIILAEFIGLYHDIGRFYQLEKYHTYNDFKSIDHAELAVKILFDDKLIDNFDFNNEEKEIIKYAIFYHNKYELEECSDERKVMHAKLIRDTDKIDILFLEAYIYNDNYLVKDVKVSDDVLKYFKEHKQVPYLEIDNFEYLRTLAFAFDINYDECLFEFKSHIQKYYHELNDKDILKDVYLEVIKYLEWREKKC